MSTELLHKESIEQLKERAFYNYFDSRVNERDGVSISIHLKDGRLVKYFMELYEKYGYKRDWDELRADYVYIAWKCIQNFKPEYKDEKQGWINILEGTDKGSEMLLVGYIKETAIHEIRKLVYPDNFQTTTKRSRKEKSINYTIVLDASSIDELRESQDGDSPRDLSVSNEDNLFNDVATYYSNPFMEWFEENKESILMPSQLEILEQLNELGDNFTREEYESLTGRSRDDYARVLKQMQNRIRKAYEKERPILKTERETYNEKVIKYYEGYMDIVDDASDLNNQNAKLSNYLVKEAEDTKIFIAFESNIAPLLDLVEREKYRAFIRGEGDGVIFSPKTLYKITEYIEKDLEKRREKAVASGFIEISELENVTYDEKGNYRRNKHGIPWDEITAGSFFKVTTNALPVKKEEPEEEK